MINHDDALLNLKSNNYAPLVTPEKYAELAGLTVKAVTSAAQEGRLPVLKRAGGRRGRIFINMKALEEFAQQQAQTFTDWQSAI